jgi:predicted lipopolysaccharide heptosyltransferase III
VALKEIKNILVTRLRFMGDVILTTPLLASLRTAYPNASITYCAETPFTDLLKNHPWIDNIVELDRKDPKSTLRLYKNILTKKYDIAIDLFGNPRSALLTWLSGAKIRIGGNFRGRRHFYTHPIKNDGLPKTAINFHLSYLGPLGLAKTHQNPLIVVSEKDNKWAQNYLSSKGFDLSQQIIGIHPGATWPAKKWFADRFAQLANALHSMGYQVLYTIGPGEDSLLKSIRDKNSFKPIKPDVLPLSQLAALLQNLSVYISNDCGPLHLAPAVGTKTVGIFGPGEPEIWFPYDRKLGHRLVFHEIDCSRCHRDLCDKMDCMKAISVDYVLEQIEDSLNN